MLKSLVLLDPEKSRRKRDSNPGSSAPDADALTTRPTRRWQARKADVLTITPRVAWRHTRDLTNGTRVAARHTPGLIG